MEQNDVHKALVMYDEIAKRLLQDQYLLTALELHLELVEAGKELPRLRDFFSCPSNFELCSRTSESASIGINRSLSQTTLDSLDWARYSEDGERLLDDRVAILEFELRKAKETIHSLRNNLTEAMAAEVQTSTENSIPICSHESEELKPHQVAMLNFLINEYLVYRGYKMTAITFADENDNQDFDNWDDVGLNIPRPRSLQQWWREKAVQLAPRVESSCQTQEMPAENSISRTEPLEKKILDLQEICRFQFEELQLHRGNTSTPMATPAKSRLPTIVDDSITNADFDDLSFYNVPTSIEDALINPALSESPDRTEASYDHVDNSAPNCIAEHVVTHGGAATSSGSETELNTVGLNPFDGESSKSSAEEVVPEDEPVPGTEVSNVDPPKEDVGDTLDDTRVTTNDIDGDNIDITNCDRLSPLGASCEWTSANVLCGEFSSAQRQEARDLLSTSSTRSVPPHLENELLKVCLSEALGTASHLQKEIAALNLGECDLINILCHSLHNIAPNIILSKREELLPLLVYCISQQADITEREKLIHLLFNLTKKPNRTQRGTILLGLVSLARVMGSACLEAEILPQCWEQLSHKHPERRILVAQSVGVLAPYTPTHIRNSLLLSMLQQILAAGEESDPRVTHAATCSLALLIAYLSDGEKIAQLLTTVLASLEPRGGCSGGGELDKDLVEDDYGFGKRLLYASLAQCCLDCGSLPQLVAEQMDRVSRAVAGISADATAKGTKSGIESAKMVLLGNIQYLSASVPYLVAMLFDSMPTPSESATPAAPISLPANFLDDLTPVMGDRDRAINAVGRLYLACESCKRWSELEHVLEQVIPRVVDILTRLEADCVRTAKRFSELVTALCLAVGPHLALNSVRTLFTNLLFVRPAQLDTVYASKVLLVVYILSVITDGNPNWGEDLPQILVQAIAVIAQSACSRLGLETALELLLEQPKYEEAVLGALWTCVLDNSTAVKIASAPLWTLLVGRIQEADVASRVVPALVTLATDTDAAVRASSLGPLSNILSRSPSRQVCDKVTLQLESLCEESQVLESIDIQCAITSTCVALGHSTHPQVLHTIFLPCICRVVLDGRGPPEDRLKFSSCTLEAFKALISASIPNHVVAHFILPVLNQLQKTLGAISVEYMEEIMSLTKEYTVRLQTSPMSDRPRSIGHSASFTSAIGSSLPISRPGVEDVKNTMSKIGRVVSSGVQNKASINLPNIFRRKQQQP